MGASGMVAFVYFYFIFTDWRFVYSLSMDTLEFI